MAFGHEGNNQAMVRGDDSIVCSGSVVTADVEVFSGTGRRTPHMTLGACFNCQGDSPPPLLVLAGPQCALEELASLQERSLWLTVNPSGWVTRREFRMWCQWFAAWRAAARTRWGLEPTEPAILVLDSASTRADLEWMRLMAANHIQLVTLRPHLTHIMQMSTSVGLARSGPRTGGA
jgi:hypothetical protein